MDKKKYLKYISILLCILLLVGCGDMGTTKDTASQATGELKVHFLNVGQADCALIQSGDQTMLIDAGNNGDEAYILSYLEEMNITEIDYAVGTHSHEDHIGSMDGVVDSLKVKNIILPKEEAQSKTYKDVLESIEKQNVNLIRPEVGEKYDLGEGTFTIIAPSENDYSDTNDFSIGLVFQYGQNRFLFTGDATEKTEKEMLKTGIDLSADVFKVAHHGGATSNSMKFLEAVDPVYAVISCGEDNQYGHPHAETLARLEDQDAQIYRTDKQGAILAVSDGKDIRWEVENSIALKDKQQNKDKNKDKTKVLEKNKDIQEYILNTSSKKFHLPECSSVKTIHSENKEKVKDNRDNLMKDSYMPCKNCNS